jgi:hypothetical protein
LKKIRKKFNPSGISVSFLDTWWKNAVSRLVFVALKETPVRRFFCYLTTMRNYVFAVICVAMTHLSAQPDNGSIIHTGQATMKQVRSLRGRLVGIFPSGPGMILPGHGIFILK